MLISSLRPFLLVDGGNVKALMIARTISSLEQHSEITGITQVRHNRDDGKVLSGGVQYIDTSSYENIECEPIFFLLLYFLRT